MESSDDEEETCDRCGTGKRLHYWDGIFGCDDCLVKTCPLCRVRDRTTCDDPFCTQCDAELKAAPHLEARNCGHWTPPCVRYDPDRRLPHPDAMCCEEKTAECVLCEHDDLDPRAYYDAVRSSSREALVTVLEKLLRDDAVETYVYCATCI